MRLEKRVLFAMFILNYTATQFELGCRDFRNPLSRSSDCADPLSVDTPLFGARSIAGQLTRLTAAEGMEWFLISSSTLSWIALDKN